MDILQTTLSRSPELERYLVSLSSGSVKAAVYSSSNGKRLVLLYNAIQELLSRIVLENVMELWERSFVLIFSILHLAISSNISAAEVHHLTNVFSPITQVPTVGALSSHTPSTRPLPSAKSLLLTPSSSALSFLPRNAAIMAPTTSGSLLILLRCLPNPSSPPSY